MSGRDQDGLAQGERRTQLPGPCNLVLKEDPRTRARRCTTLTVGVLWQLYDSWVRST